jgi:hypothetical protein
VEPRVDVREPLAHGLLYCFVDLRLHEIACHVRGIARDSPFHALRGGQRQLIRVKCCRLALQTRLLSEKRAAHCLGVETHIPSICHLSLYSS